MKHYVFSFLWLYFLSFAASLISLILSFITIFYSELSSLLLSLCVVIVLLVLMSGGAAAFQLFPKNHTPIILVIYSFVLILLYFLSSSGIPFIGTISTFSVYFLLTAMIFLQDVLTAGLISIPSFLSLIICIIMMMSSFYAGILLKSTHQHR